MASTSRGKKSRGARGKGATGGAKKRSAAKASKSTTRAARGGAKKRTATAGRAKAARSAKAAKPAAGNAAVATLKARFEREKGALERRLTASVREIGQLRIHESRVTQLERQLKERDDTITQLRGQIAGLRDRSAALVDDPEVQPSLALGERTSRDLDDFDDVALDDDDELV